MPVACAVNVVKLAVDLLERDRGADQDVDRVLLAHVAHVGGASDVAVGGTDPLRLEQRGAFRLERSEGTGYVVGLQLGKRPVEAPNHVVAHVRLQHAPGREGARAPGNDHLADLELLGKPDGVHRAGSAERDEGVLARDRSPV